MYEWSDIRLFLAVVREGSTLGAAKSLGVNQTTVSRRMQILEHQLGLTLFDRQTSGYRLTKNGEALLKSAQAVRSAADNLESAARRLGRTISGVVRVTAAESVANLLIIPIAAEFRALHPDAHVEQVAADSRLDIVHGEADVAFRVDAPPSEPSLVAQRLPDIAWSVYCSENYAKSHKPPTRAGQIADHDVIGYEGKIQDTGGYHWFIGFADQDRITSRSNTVPNMTAVLRSGLGIGALPCMMGDNQPDLKRCFDPPPQMAAEFWLLTSQQARNSPQVRAFIDFAVPRIIEQKQLLSGQAAAKN